MSLSEKWLYINKKTVFTFPLVEKAEEPEIKLPTLTGSERKQRNSRKTSTSA